MPNFWTFRNSNDLIYVIEKDQAKEDAFLFQSALGDNLRKLLSPGEITVCDPEKPTATLFKITPNWQALVSIEIQGNKTLADRAGKSKNATFHIKCYFDGNYALKNFKGADKKEMNGNLQKICKYFDEKKDVGSAKDLFNDAEALKATNAVVVKDLADFVTKSADKWSLPKGKNVYMFTTAYVEMLKNKKTW
jgi:hypothetical protein